MNPTQPKRKRDLCELQSDECLVELRRREGGWKQDEKIILHSDKSDYRLALQEDLSQHKDEELYEVVYEGQKVEYGIDDRREAYEIDDGVASAHAASVVALMDVSSIKSNGNGTSTLHTVRFADSHNLCAGERFREQPTAAFGTGFLVAPDVIVTAGHCVNGNNLARTRFVFGFRMRPSRFAVTTLSDTEIYKGVGIIARQNDPNGADFAVIRLDRAVTNRPALAIRRDANIPDGQSVYVIGHPCGLPLKYAPGAVVRDNSPTTHFVANLDTYGGNSGSPVFNGDTGMVEGVLVRGETDFVLVGGCRVSNVCPTTGCRGEDVTRTSQFARYISSLPATPSRHPPVTDLATRVQNLERKVDKIHESVEALRSSGS